MNEIAIKTINITKKYKGKLAVNNVNMTVNKGEIYGLIGKNGAGKTTLIRMITGLIHSTNGEVEILGKSGKELDDERKCIGSIVESPSFYGNLTARENLEISRRVRGIPDKACIDNVLELLNLKDTGKKKVKDFSLGMRQKLGIANALLGNPKILILDEPINGLDPVNIVKVRELLKKINREKNITIIISSHILEELSEMATCYGIVNDGVLLEEISAKDLRENCKQYIQIQVDDVKKATVVLEQRANIKNYKVIDSNLINIYECLDNTEMINRCLIEEGVGVKGIKANEQKLEDYFMKVIGGERHE